MKLKEFFDLDVSEFWKSQPKPGSAAGIPLTPAGPLVADVPIVKPVEKQGIDYHTAQDLINMGPGARLEWTDLDGDVLMAIHLKELTVADDKKLRFYRR